MAPGRRGRERQRVFKQAVFKQSVFRRGGRRLAQGRRVKRESAAPAVARLKQASVASLAQAIPLHTDGMRIGLLGGSFNPPHDAHRAISLFAIKRLKLDRLVWIMGADNLAQFHRWQNWRRIASEVPIAVIDRPPQSFRALAAPAAQALARYRLPENQAGRLADQHAPAWVFLTGMKLSLSSTGLRNQDGSWRTK